MRVSDAFDCACMLLFIKYYFKTANTKYKGDIEKIKGEDPAPDSSINRVKNSQTLKFNILQCMSIKFGKFIKSVDILI